MEGRAFLHVSSAACTYVRACKRLLRARFVCISMHVHTHLHSKKRTKKKNNSHHPLAIFALLPLLRKAGGGRARPTEERAMWMIFDP